MTLKTRVQMNSNLFRHILTCFYFPTCTCICSYSRWKRIPSFLIICWFFVFARFKCQNWTNWWEMMRLIFISNNSNYKCKWGSRSKSKYGRIFWKLKICFRKSELCSDLERIPQKLQLKMNLEGLPEADDNIYKDW